MENKQAEEILCKTYTGFHGEEVDNINQIKLASFDGEDLKDFCELYLKLSHQSQLREIREILESRINIIKSEPNGIVRETMIDQLLIELF
jgi:hypothetical protein